MEEEIHTRVSTRVSFISRFVFILAFVHWNLKGVTVSAALPPCAISSNSKITSKCKFAAAVEYNFDSLEVDDEVFLETTGSRNRHIIRVTNTLTLTSKAIIHVGANLGSALGDGVSNSNGGSGGSHGGRGGVASGMSLQSNQTLPHGDTFAPLDTGSSGGDGGITNAGGKGGSVLSIFAGTIIMNGVIRNNGKNAKLGSNGGGGSGGGIMVNCTTLSGVGVFEAFGGQGRGNGGGGSGGRISLLYKSGSFSTKQSLAHGGRVG